MKKITLIGSTRFLDRFNEINAKLTLQGNLVYSVAVSSTEANGELPYEDKETLDLVHLLKIQDSDAVVLIGAQEDGSYYLGSSTRREIRWALMNGKEIWLERAWSYDMDRLTRIWEGEERSIGYESAIDYIMKAQQPDPERLEAKRAHKAFMEQLSRGTAQVVESEKPN